MQQIKNKRKRSVKKIADNNLIYDEKVLMTIINTSFNYDFNINISDFFSWYIKIVSIIKGNIKKV